MLIFGNKAFVHVPKTGGTWARHVISSTHEVKD